MLRLATGLLATVAMLCVWLLIIAGIPMLIALYIARAVPLAGRRRRKPAIRAGDREHGEAGKP